MFRSPSEQPGHPSVAWSVAAAGGVVAAPTPSPEPPRNSAEAVRRTGVYHFIFDRAPSRRPAMALSSMARPPPRRLKYCATTAQSGRAARSAVGPRCSPLRRSVARREPGWRPHSAVCSPLGNGSAGSRINLDSAVTQAWPVIRGAMRPPPIVA
jgi:hypothetical protein